ncbi:hypothetical protein AOLI_G00316590 [Acnodon oligacanthus]
MLGLHPGTKAISRRVYKAHFDERGFTSFMEVKLHYLSDRHLHLKPDSVPASAEHQHFWDVSQDKLAHELANVANDFYLANKLLLRACGIISSLLEAVEFSSTVILTCSAKGSFLSYKWLNGSNPVVVDGKHLALNGSQLIITEVLRTDLRGSVYCIAENQLESVKSTAFNMSVSCAMI